MQSDLQKAIRTERYIGRLVGVYGAVEWSANDQANIAVINFEFIHAEQGSDMVFWRKARIFSSDPDVARRATITVEEIDKSCQAHGVIASVCMESENLILDSESSRVTLVDPQFIATLPNVLLLQAYSETRNRQTGQPYISSWLARVLAIDEGYAPDHPIAAMRDISNFTYTREWLYVRLLVLNLVGKECMCCGAKTGDAVVTVDHVKPRSKFPTLALSPSNLQVLCRECNAGKGDHSEMDYRTPEQVEQLVDLQRRMAEQEISFSAGG